MPLTVKEAFHMNRKFTFSLRRVALTLVPAGLFLVASPSQVVGYQHDTLFFVGGGYGPTPEVAIQMAFWDAEASAQSFQRYACELVGEPQLFPGPNPARRRNFGAQVVVAC
jgi:hypothetical protein